MKRFRKDFINEITNEAEAYVNVERYLFVYHLLKKNKVPTPELIDYGKTHIVLEFIPQSHTRFVRPDFESFHNLTLDYYRKFDIEKAEFRIQFLKPEYTDLSNKICKKLKNIALSEIDIVFKNDKKVFLHMDAVYKNYYIIENKTVWIDFQDAMIGPKSYDEAHYLVDCFNKVDFDVESFSELQKRSALYNSIRQFAIFAYLPRFKKLYADTTKYNINRLLKGLDYDLEIT
jgi:thiamine kinase-like enzyme